MNEIQRINALNEWFLGECSKKSQEFIVDVIKEWDELSGHLPLCVWLERGLENRWLEWVGGN